MAKRGLARKLLAAFIAVVLGATLPALMIFERVLGQEVRVSRRNNLERQAGSLARELEHSTPPDLADWTREVASLTGTRITVIALDGQVLADSAVFADVFGTLENHAGRPEVKAALAGGVGDDIRQSATLGNAMMYVAVPVGNPPTMIVRLALGLDEVDDAVTDARRALWLAGATALALAVLLGLLLSRRLSRPVEAMTRAAQRMTAGDFAVELPRARPGGDELDALSGALGKLRDDLAARLEQLGDERQKLRAVVEGMAEGVMLIDNGIVALANPALVSLLGAVHPIEGKTPIEASRVPELAEAVANVGARENPTETEALVADKVLRLEAQAIGAPARRQILVTVTDTTEMRRLERLRREFVANASHELRTPVAAIVGVAETLAHGAAEDPTARKSFLEILLRHADRLSRLTKDLLDIARLEAGYRPRSEHISALQAIDAVVATLASPANQKQVRVERSEARGIQVSAEAAAFDQILTNLIDNAIKYTPNGGTVRVDAKREGDRVRISIVDSGPGIPAEHLPRLFERFYRVDDARSRDIGGTGLGLAIVKHLVLANQGDVGVESTVGQGSRFWVTLPSAS